MLRLLFFSNIYNTNGKTALYFIVKKIKERTYKNGTDYLTGIGNSRFDGCFCRSYMQRIGIATNQNQTIPAGRPMVWRFPSPYAYNRLLPWQPVYGQNQLCRPLGGSRTASHNRYKHDARSPLEQRRGRQQPARRKNDVCPSRCHQYRRPGCRHIPIGNGTQHLDFGNMYRYHHFPFLGNGPKDRLHLWHSPQSQSRTCRRCNTYTFRHKNGAGAHRGTIRPQVFLKRLQVYKSTRPQVYKWLPPH